MAGRSDHLLEQDVGEPNIRCARVVAVSKAVSRVAASWIIDMPIPPPPNAPGWDSVVSQVLGTERAHLNPVREALRADDAALHRRLLSIREEAGLPEEISALRVFDVIAWMDGKNRRLGEPSDLER
ncbi:DUF6308 family protein [Rhodococcus sp. WAY2]|uniref:DUF6308 family protein n=1 Tax=Rhodococcus sp. WAY2 TaxID=2663121 RepID=UPI0013200F06|nr:DUF6308 family protein [Rhodococcus sp. WAY2]QHE72564.1 hypothetical protein GFS60_06207 [Rhodococcus sp. WAY2]